MDELEETLGVRPAMGGRHPGFGTHNALLSLGPDAYLELLAVDPDQERPPRSKTMELLDIATPRLINWAIRTDDIDTLVMRSRSAGYDPGRILRMQRQRPDGQVIEWRLTSDPPDWPGALVPFVIDWETSPHPAASSPKGVSLSQLRAEHPQPSSVLPALRALQADLGVAHGPQPALIATVETPKGTVELR